MQVEFTSLFEASRVPSSTGHGFPVAALLRHAGLLEDAEIDRLLITAAPGGEQPNQAAFLVLENAPSVGAVLSHRVGDISPVTAAEQFGLFDQLSRGRLSIRLTPPATAAFAEKHNAHELIFENLDEYLTLLKRLWASEDPFDFEGQHHRIVGGHVASKPFRGSKIPLILGGQSGTAVKVAAKHADVFALNPAPLAALRQDIARVRAAALGFGRADRIAFSLSVRPLIADSRDEAWAKSAALGPVNPEVLPETRLIGTTDQVALQFINLADLGVTDFVLHGLQDEEQLERFVQRVLPLVRNAISRQEARGLRDLLTGSGTFGMYPTPRL